MEPFVITLSHSNQPAALQLFAAPQGKAFKLFSRRLVDLPIHVLDLFLFRAIF